MSKITIERILITIECWIAENGYLILLMLFFVFILSLFICGAVK